MVKVLSIGLLCVASAAAHAETFVIGADQAGHEATVKIPVGAVTKLSADSCEALNNYADPEVEAMRLRGDVLISIAGSDQPIEIKAENVVLELTADFASGTSHGRGETATNKVLRAATTLGGDDGSQTFVGNVLFDLQTASGTMQIKADRVEHQLQTENGA
jgi:hypothetical protein